MSGQTTLECLEVWRCQRARGHIVRKKIWKLIPKKIKMKPVKWELQRFRKDSAKIDSLVNIGVPRRILKEWPESFRN